MHEFLHLFGFCADHNAHLNLLSFVGDNVIVNQINLFFKQVYSYIVRKVV